MEGSSLPSEHLSKVLTPGSLTTQLSTEGYAVIDNAFGSDWCEIIREEMDTLAQSDLFSPSKNKLSSTTGDGHILTKHGIYELDMIFEGKEVCKPECWMLAENLAFLAKKEMPRLVEILNASYPDLELTELDHMKLQINYGNGSFPMHFDTHSSTARSRRHLTFILYLNPSWTTRSGGEIRLYPLPYPSIDIAPLNDRVALFCSHSMLHRVMPSHDSRYCFSLWFASKSSIPFPVKLREKVEGFDEILHFLFDKEKRRMLSKILYAEEWEQSVRESFGDLPEVEDSMSLHWKEVKKLEIAFSPELIALLKEYLPLKTGSEVPQIIK
uniref:Prolyl 4-hydroxylase alpha subunit domain-containing protein n=1 Tax=Arcella intermedia TaxID=1963864 RepID=A0A6B2LA22_9EUKA